MSVLLLGILERGQSGYEDVERVAIILRKIEPNLAINQI
jgi:hypothetical protein